MAAFTEDMALIDFDAGSLVLDDDDCLICLSRFYPGQHIAVNMPCQHAFHAICSRKWHRMANQWCPKDHRRLEAISQHLIPDGVVRPNPLPAGERVMRNPTSPIPVPAPPIKCCRCKKPLFVGENRLYKSCSHCESVYHEKCAWISKCVQKCHHCGISIASSAGFVDMSRPKTYADSTSDEGSGSSSDDGPVGAGGASPDALAFEMDETEGP